ncbi:MAG: type II toxin-antitoxin system HicA family toxin [Desulfobacterales bacterium]
MNSKHRRTLSAIFSHPTPGNLEWRRIEALFVALNAKVMEGDGSRVSFVINDEKGDFHRPHPGKEAKRYQVRNAENFLTRAGVTP